MPDLRLIRGRWPVERTPTHEQRVERLEEELWETTVEDLHDRLNGVDAAALIKLLEICAYEEAIEDARAEHEDKDI